MDGQFKSYLEENRMLENFCHLGEHQQKILFDKWKRGPGWVKPPKREELSRMPARSQARMGDRPARGGGK